MKFVVLDGYTLNPGDLSWDGFHELGELTVYDRTPAEKIIERAQGAECLLTNKTPLSRETLEQLPDVKYIGVLATGYNVVDVAAAAGKGIVVANIPTYGTSSVAQMVFSHILNLVHPVAAHNDAVKEGAWTATSDFCFWKTPLIELQGKTLGVIGFGRIGQNVADIAEVFGMHIVAYDAYQTDQSYRKNFSWGTQDEVFAKADILTLHCPLFPDTEGIVNKETIEKMKPTAFIVNTSRGPLINEKDLADALNRGRIAGAGVDVLAVEPPKAGNPLLSAKNCNITPHIAWATKEARSRLMDIAVENAKNFLAGTPTNQVS